ncbi:hypothetical protein [uncultured Ralstonia sp.]|jgi:hypothetical protein|uniref:hypothetical protein n=1 Tax=Ralstonia sp. TaxID=54061 RepID=UPI0025E840C8|nr:hypothetical protein [uncultured Ralstonia sp.]
MRTRTSLFSPSTPEKMAEKELREMRLTLFQAERHLLEVQMHVAYYRDMVAFLEDVQASGVEQVVDNRRMPGDDALGARAALRAVFKAPPSPEAKEAGQTG